MKATLKKISDVCKIIFGYGIMIVLFAGGLTFFGYVAALIFTLIGKSTGNEALLRLNPLFRQLIEFIKGKGGYTLIR